MSDLSPITIALPDGSELSLAPHYTAAPVPPPAPVYVRTVIGATSATVDLNRFPRLGATTLFNAPGKGINVTAYKAVPAGVIPVVCFKDAPTAGIINPLLDALTGPIVLVHHHEPEADGPVEDYRAKVIATADIIDAHPNRHLVTFAAKLLLYSELHGYNASDWITGREDVIGWDAYLPFNSTSYQDPAAFVGQMAAWASAANKPWALFELGSIIVPSDTDGSGYAAWLAGVVHEARATGCRYVMVWDMNGTQRNYTMTGKPLSVWQAITASQ